MWKLVLNFGLSFLILRLCEVVLGKVIREN